MRQMVRSVVAEMLAQHGVGRHASVTSVDPVNALVKVSYDENNEAVSGWLPIAQQGAGNGWGMVCLPTAGTQVYVAPDMGDIAHGVVMGSVHSIQQPPGKVTPYKASEAIPLVPGEVTFIHSSGASLRLTDGAVEIHGDLKVDGDIIASGQVIDLNGIHGTLDDLRELYNEHKHGGIQPGGNFTATTDHPTP